MNKQLEITEAELSKFGYRLETGNHNTPYESPLGFNVPDKSELHSRVESFINDSEVEIPDRYLDEVNQVLSVIYDGGPMHESLGFGREAVAIADGSRPVFFIEKDVLALKGNPSGPFVEVVKYNSTAVQGAALSVGRIETDEIPARPKEDKYYVGTGWMVSDNLIMTNRHVMEAMIHQEFNDSEPFTFKKEYWINFGAQIDTPSRRFLIKRVEFAGPKVIRKSGDFERLDMALFSIERPEEPQLVLPNPLTISARIPEPGEPIAVIGFPATPDPTNFAGVPSPASTLDRILWLFDKRFGYKRVSSGEVDSGPGFPAAIDNSYPEDTKKWVIQHDASTLGGSSGGVILSLKNSSDLAVGLHFGGIHKVTNFGHSFDKLRDDLQNFGVSVSS